MTVNSSIYSIKKSLFEDYDYMVKLLFVGDSFVGKSSILLRFTEGTFEPDHQCTIGVDFKVHLMTWNQLRLNVTIWDTAGQEKFRSLTTSYYRGAHGIILVYDITNRDTFLNIGKVWLEEIELYATTKNIVKCLVGNKLDQEDRRAVPVKEAQEFADRHHMLFVECSSKTGVGVNEVFNKLISKIVSTPGLLESTLTTAHIDTTKQTISITNASNTNNAEEWKCSGYLCTI
jgi:Ras-related protein Rab-18